MKSVFFRLTLVGALMLLALPAFATPDAGWASPGPSIVAKVMDAFASLWRVVAPEVAAPPSSEVQAKDGDDRRDDGAPPLAGLGAVTDPDG